MVEEIEKKWSCLALKYNDDLICPYCNEKQEISGEDYLAEGDESKFDCGNCEKEFSYECNYTITYNSYGLGEIPKEND